MRKSFKLLDLDCAHCAAKMEDAINQLDGVSCATVNFLGQKLTIEGDDARFDQIVREAIAVCRRIEPDCEVVV